MITDDTRGGEPGHAADVDGRFGMAGANQSAAVTRYERKYVAGRDDVVGALVRINGRLDYACAVGGADACGYAIARLDRNLRRIPTFRSRLAWTR